MAPGYGSVSKLTLIHVSIVICFISTNVLATWRDFDLALNHAQYINDNQSQLTTQTIILELNQIKNALSSMIFGTIPRRFRDRGPLLINSLALLRLTDVNNEKCLQQGAPTLSGSDHQANYIQLANISRKGFRSKIMQQVINIYESSQQRLCVLNLVINFGKCWFKVLKSDKDASQFTRLLSSMFPQDKSMAELSIEEKMGGILKFIKQYYNIDELQSDYHEKINRAYNGLFKNHCGWFISNPFHTLMTTYESTGRTRTNVERYFSDQIKIYDLCSNLPDGIENIGSIGEQQV